MRLQILVFLLCVIGSLVGQRTQAASDERSREGSVTVVKATFGLFIYGKKGELVFQPSSIVPLVDNQTFGWQIELRTTRRFVRVREELVLPKPPKTWGLSDPRVTHISSDRRTATTEGEFEVQAGTISNAWSLAAGDPKGQHLIRVKIEDLDEIRFEFDVR